MNQQKFAKIPFSAAQSPIFYGWPIVLFGTLGILISTPGQTIGVSTFTDSLLDALAIHRDTLSFAYMCGTLLSATILTRAGKLYDKFGVRPLAIAAAVGLGLALVYMSQVDKIVDFVNGILGGKSTVVLFIIVLFGFLAMRFCGQGVLTLASRTMMMKWFEERRGFALGFASVFVALGFSMAPVVFENLIQAYGWRLAWQYIALVLIVICPIVIFVFFRNDPQDVGLTPDGDWQASKDAKKKFEVHRDFTLKEARITFPFIVVTGVFAMNGLFITGFTFHVVSIFEAADMSRQVAVSVFQPSAVVAVSITLAFSWLADKVKVKYLLMVMCLGGCLGILGMIFLAYEPFGFYSIVIGNGITIGLYGIIVSVVWPRFFGKAHLGAIIGQSMTVIVFGSAIGPYLLSASLSQFGSYAIGGWICFGLYFLLLIGAFRIRNPQVDAK